MKCATQAIGFEMDFNYVYCLLDGWFNFIVIGLGLDNGNGNDSIKSPLTIGQAHFSMLKSYPPMAYMIFASR